MSVNDDYDPAILGAGCFEGFTLPDLNDPETLRGALMEAVKEIQQDRAELSRLQQENSRLQEQLANNTRDCMFELGRKDDQSLMAAALLTKLKEECEAQHARAEKAEQENSRLQQERDREFHHRATAENNVERLRAENSQLRVERDSAREARRIEREAFEEALQQEKALRYKQLRIALGPKDKD